MSTSTSNDEGAMELVQRPVFNPSGAGKSDNEVKVQHVDNDIESDSQPDIAGSARSAYDDIRGMQRMGKQQQFDRNFRQLSLTAFVSLATASWEIGLFIISPALIDGGRAGLVWSSLWCWIGFAPIYLSMVRIRAFETMDRLRKISAAKFELQLQIYIRRELTSSFSVGGDGQHGSNRRRTIP